MSVGKEAKKDKMANVTEGFPGEGDPEETRTGQTVVFHFILWFSWWVSSELRSSLGSP